MYDSHCHPQFPQYDNDREDVIKRALDGGVKMICVGTDLEMSGKAIELAEKHESIWASIGLHPNDITEDFDIAAYQNLSENPGVVAIGEVGLDYYRTPESEKQKKQKEVFEQFIELYQKTNKPLILHFRDSPKGSSGKVHKDALEILSKNFNKGVSHSFTGNLEEAREYVNRGMFIGLNGIITFARQYDEVVRYVPLENILLETDAPFLAPEPIRSRQPSYAKASGGRARNEPLWVKYVAEKIAEL